MRIARGWFPLAAIAVLLAFVVSGCSSARDPWQDVPGDGPKVLVSFPPLYCFVANVGKEHVKVISLCKSEGPHHYSPTAYDSLLASGADVFFVNGLTLDDWIAKVKRASGNKQLPVIAVGDRIDKKLLLPFRGGPSHAEDAGHGHHHVHGEYDPHVWLGVEQAKAMVGIIAEELSNLEPAHAEMFRANAEAYCKKLDDLRDYGLNRFAAVKNRRLIATHDSLGYFAKTFHLEVVDNIMPQAGVEADANKLAELVKVLTDIERPVRVITVEPQYSRQTAKTLIQQVKGKGVTVKLVEFDTLETAPSQEALTERFYIDAMRGNIDRLAEALQP